MKNLFLLLFILFFTKGFTQVIISGSGSFTQNFDALLNSGSVNDWVDNSTVQNIFSQRTSTSTLYAAGTGSSSSGGLYSFGASGSNERALGTIGSGNSSFGGDFAHGILLQNTSGQEITNLNVSYTMEQWRNGGKITADTLSFWYQLSSGSISNLTPTTNTGWTAVVSLNAISPTNTLNPGAIDGNDPLNRVVLSGNIPNLIIPNGSFIMLRWFDPDHAGSDHGLAIDDLTLSWTMPCLNPITFYEDSDGDGFGNVNSTVSTCEQPVGFVSNDYDCNDADLLINPNTVWYLDSDNDNFGDLVNSFLGCTPPSNNFVLSSTDCDDSNNQIYPGATEICDAVDNDCDGSIDEGLNFITYYTDADNDGFGTGSTGLSFCEIPGPGFSTNNQDCDDTNGQINPNATDATGNGIDENCDGVDGILGISNELFVNFELIPNPASDFAKVSIFTSALIGNLLIQDMNGKTLSVEKINGQTTLYINVNHLAPGIYLVMLTSSNGTITKRLVKN
ncbi:MAG: T9SS C-terminal target domain-containing protein [Flavobacteriales bacterium]|nr:T9SS C-terminal target domain-containing protein [Flavobacteriales bacterium]